MALARLPEQSRLYSRSGRTALGLGVVHSVKPLVDCIRYRRNNGGDSFCSIGKETCVYEASHRSRSCRDNVGVSSKLRGQAH